MKKKIKIKKELRDNGVYLLASFQKERVYTIHQSGEVLDKSKKGVRVMVKIPLAHTKGFWEVASNDGSHGGSGTLTFSRKLVTDYDGAFNLPHLVGKVLKQEGYKLEWEKDEPKKKRA